eukprot:990223-Pyramimonas_sp.AAC.1
MAPYDPVKVKEQLKKEGLVISVPSLVILKALAIADSPSVKYSRSRRVCKKRVALMLCERLLKLRLYASEGDPLGVP